jgi:predicted permease
LTFAPRGGQNERMTSPDATPKPFQFGLRSIFLVTAAVGVALGLLKWLGPRDFLTVVFFTAPFAATAAILVKTKGGWASLWASFLLVLVVFVAILLMIGLYVFCGGR